MGDSNVHAHKRVPLVLVGHASGAIKGNLNVRAKDGTPHSNALLAVINKLGINQNSIGDSTGAVAIYSGPQFKKFRGDIMFLKSLLCGIFAVSCLAAAVGDTRLSNAAMQGDRQLVTSLLAQKVDVNSSPGRWHDCAALGCFQKRPGYGDPTPERGR